MRATTMGHWINPPSFSLLRWIDKILHGPKQHPLPTPTLGKIDFFSDEEDLDRYVKSFRS